MFPWYKIYINICSTESILTYVADSNTTHCCVVERFEYTEYITMHAIEETFLQDFLVI